MNTRAWIHSPALSVSGVCRGFSYVNVCAFALLRCLFGVVLQQVYPQLGVSTALLVASILFDFSVLLLGQQIVALVFLGSVARQLSLVRSVYSSRIHRFMTLRDIIMLQERFGAIIAS